MVSSQLCGLTKGRTCEPYGARLLLSANPPEAVLPEEIEVDFSDVFGPLPVQGSIELKRAELETELVYDEPVNFYSRWHSLLASSLVTAFLKLSKLTLRETVDLADHTKASSISIEDFEVLKVVGQGGFGKVYQVRKKGTQDIYAMKVMRKDKIMRKNLAQCMQAERDILTQVDHPFIVKLRYSFQTKHRLYLILDFINGGDLYFQLYHHGLFREDLARIYAAEIVSAVSHLHANGIMHRDLKPENVLLDADGHVILTDFGLAKQFDENERSNSLCGTVEYMAPEIISGKGYDKAADWWSVGILIFEMLTGNPPFTGNRGKIQQQIVKKRMKLPKFLSNEAHSLLKGLLRKDPDKRLGSGPTGSEKIKECKWFKTINWKKLEAREIQPNFLPEISGRHCIANFDKEWTDMPLTFSPASSPKTTTNPFTDFNYTRPAATTPLHQSSSLC